MKVDIEIQRTAESLDQGDHASPGLGAGMARLLDEILNGPVRWKGKLSTHWRMGKRGRTPSTSRAALSTLRWAPQLGQKRCRLQF